MLTAITAGSAAANVEEELDEEEDLEEDDEEENDSVLFFFLAWTWAAVQSRMRERGQDYENQHRSKKQS